VYSRSLRAPKHMAIIVSVVLASERPRPDARAYTPSPPRALASHVRLRGAHDTQLHVESPRSRPLRFSGTCTQPTATAGGYASIQKRGRGGGCLAGTGRRRRYRGEGETTEKRRQRCNTRFTFETFGCNTCNIRLKTDETHETCI